ncbi:MAG: efflux RND transporter periplasmic adaptor subunit [Ginsengibacter sp.]
MKFTLLILIVILLFISCKNKKTEVTINKDVFYTCSMHPQVIQDKPGDCPICGMKLIAVNKTTGDSLSEIKLSDQQIQLGNISFDTIRNANIGNDIILPATLSIDQDKLNSVSARVSGRIEKLYYKNIGEFVPPNAKLYDLYSEELNNAKQEYLTALERQNNFKDAIIDFSQLISNAKNKLLLWGMKESQIQDMAKSKKLSPLTTFYNTSAGSITSFGINEGDYVEEGGSVLSLTGLSTLWAEAQLYSSQLSLIENDAMAIVKFADMPEYVVHGKIDFQNPEINEGTRLNLIRIVIPNKDNRLKPGMAAYVTLSNKKHSNLSLPIDAVLRDDKSASVWMKTDKNTFQNKMVTVGMETNDQIEIKSGLKPGDVIVLTGAYLLNSEYIFKKGASPMAGHFIIRNSK